MFLVFKNVAKISKIIILFEAFLISVCYEKKHVVMFIKYQKFFNNKKNTKTLLAKS